jgi:eukaryotic-like serine/threonine-protein kinase
VVETGPRLLGNRYELQTVLASGGMGRVWRARDTLLNRPVAVKVLRSEFTADPGFLARFRAEAQHAAVLIHPNIASVFDYGEVVEDGEHLAYLVMELVEGDSLATVLARNRRLDVPQSLGILRSTAAALAAAHAAGVVHRDIKPGNVLVGRDGAVKITDFGIAWSASSVPLTQTGQVIGTAHYLSPEQAQGGKATAASDVYALGAVAYECLAGRRAFDGESSVQIAVKQIREHPDPLPPDIPSDVRRLVERAMAKDPAQRFPDGAALRDAVDAVTGHRPTAPIAGLGAGPGVPTGRTGTAVMSLPPAGAPLAPAPATAVGDAGTPGRRALVRAALGGLAVLVLLAVVIGVLQHTVRSSADQPTAGTTSSSAPSSSPSAAATTRPVTVSVVAADYVGRKATDVQTLLAGKGLRVTMKPVTTSHTAAGLVTAVTPAGQLAPGSAVTVSYAVAPVAVSTPKAPAPPHKSHRKHKGGD